LLVFDFVTTASVVISESKAINSRQDAWLETKLGVRVPVNGTCSIGRARSNSVNIPSDRVSRRHALVHRHGDGEYLLIDLGSSNGTILNGRPINHLTVLHDGDMIEIGPARLLFRNAVSDGEESGLLMQDIASSSEPCWLLVAATENANLAKHEEAVDECFKTVKSWSFECELIVKRFEGAVARQSGEDMFAYWQSDESNLDSTQKILEALAQLQKLQAQNGSRFRIALHYGKVLIEAATSQNYASLEGSGVTLAFHLQRLAWRFPVDVLLSKAAATALAPLAKARPIEMADISATTQPLFTL